MIAADTSSLIDFLRGAPSPDVDRVRRAFMARELWLPPPVVTELLSAPMAQGDRSSLLAGARILPIAPGFWERAGETRRTIIGKGLRARLADTLIAQSCIDAGAPLIASDLDFHHFARWCGLVLA